MVHQNIPAGAGHGTAGHLVSEDVLLADPEFLEDVGLGLRVPSGVAGLADPSVALGGGDHRPVHVVWKELYLVVPKARMA